MATNDPYAVLGVAPGADPTTIRRAFRRCARHTHPDAGGDATAFARIRTAYELLVGPAARAAAADSGPEAPVAVGADPRLPVPGRDRPVPYRLVPGRTWTREVREQAARPPAPPRFADVLAAACRAA